MTYPPPYVIPLAPKIPPRSSRKNVKPRRSSSTTVSSFRVDSYAMTELCCCAAEPLTEKQLAEKEALIAQGFEDWSRRDFQQFIRGLETYGW